MKARTIVGWVVSLLLFVAFLGASFAKLTTSAMMVQEFASFGYPLWFMYVTGAIELVSAVLVIVPRTSSIGAALLVCVMLGAIFSHLTHGQAARVGAPIVLLVLAAIAFVLRRPGTTALATTRI